MNNKGYRARDQPQAIPLQSVTNLYKPNTTNYLF